MIYIRKINTMYKILLFCTDSEIWFIHNIVYIDINFWYVHLDMYGMYCRLCQQKYGCKSWQRDWSWWTVLKKDMCWRGSPRPENKHLHYNQWESTQNIVVGRMFLQWSNQVWITNNLNICWKFCQMSIWYDYMRTVNAYIIGINENIFCF